MIYRSAHLIANNIAVEAAIPFHFGAGVVLRRPDEHELPRIRELLSPLARPYNPYECRFTPKEDGGTRIDWLENPDQWHYYVLADDAGGSGVHDLEPALLLMEPSIELSIRLISSLPETGGTPTSHGHAPPQPHVLERYHYYVVHNTDRVTVRTADFQVAENLRIKLTALPSEYDFIRHASAMMKEIQIIPRRSRLKIIGYFSIIESLIAHKPRLPESLDSILHQIQGKLNLLCNEANFGDMVDTSFESHGAIWRRLYAYRSALAHGSSISFDGQFAELKSQETVASFLAVLARRLLLLGLERPQLLLDLRGC